MPTPTSTDAAQPAVEFTDVTLAFDDGAGVFDVSFAIPKQSITVMTGPSGCGKSTVLRLILGLHEPDTGDVRVLGQYPADFTLKDRGHIAYVPQEFALYPRLTVLENIRFASSVYGLGPFRRKDRITKALEMVQLNDVRHRKADDLSGGMRRRLQLAAALIHDGGLLIADEPTAGVDPILRVRIWEHLQQLRDDGHTIIVTTQYINEAEYGDRVFVMRAGYLLTAGSPEEIRKEALGGELINIVLEDPSQTTQATAVLESLEGVHQAYPLPEKPAMVRIRVGDNAPSLVEITEACQAEGIETQQVQPYVMPFENVFQHIVREEEEVHA